MDAEKVTQNSETKSHDINPSDKQQENPDPLPLKDETENPSPLDESQSPEAEIVQQLPTDDGVKTTDDGHVQEDDSNNDEVKVEDSSPLPPDLGKVSEEIDQFISDLSNLKGDNESKPPDVPVFVEQFAVLVEAKIEDYDGGDAPIKWSQLSQEDAMSFLEFVDRMSKLLNSLCQFSSEYKYAYSISRVDGVLQRAMSYIEEEFKSILYDFKIPDSDFNSDTSTKPNKETNSSSDANQDAEQSSVAESAPSEDNKFPGYTEEIVTTMNKLSKALIAGGYEVECCQVYFLARRKALEECLHKLGFEKHSIDDVQKMHWDSLEREITAWIITFKHCTNVLHSSERKLADAVFADQPSIAEKIFSNLSRGMMIQLLNFAEAVAMTKRAAEKLFKFLDIYETLRDLLPLVDKMFVVSYADELKAEATLTRSRLGESMVSIFSELENSIQADSNKTPVPGGAVHPLTRYIMNYLKYVAEYRDTLEQVFREHQMIERADSTTGSDFDCQNPQAQRETSNKLSPFEAHMMKVMDLLDANLEAKSRLYKDTSLSSIFMMNNGRYILQKIKGSPEINGLMGDQWYRKRSSDLRQYHKTYQRETWGKLLQCLNHEGLNVNGKVNKPILKERFKSFNALFDEIHKTQSSWVISDEQLQSELRVSISNMVIPAYRSFLGRFSQTFTPGRQTEKYVKYQPEEIETHIDELFDGNATPWGRKKL
ncbi:PREDICTED: exocyst complex component EXO70B1-like [Nicotiana attenuata]|uniref:Exocyst subunit Exo70 family protein n=1 Tax=Nicotiana attenuata TaxID=49451 RepID=A0A314L3A2_NICAT|nr:PREDICTED: exocyst complex component EXO70B1-like [Nicotiana attenuata]OIT36136.1 exocyst complex component exo70b1 [Nicotiana attenuata]